MTESQSLVERLAGEADRHADKVAEQQEWAHVRDAKFAELVARECAKAADQSSAVFTQEGVQVKSLARAAIRQRFGVGE